MRDSLDTQVAEASQHLLELNTTEVEERRAKIKWPKTSDKRAWGDLEEDLDKILESALSGPAERKLVAMTNLVYMVSRERFGVLKNIPSKSVQTPNRRQRLISDIRAELRTLRRAFRTARDEENIGLKQLRDEQRRELLTLRQAERTRTKRRKRERTRAAFISNPYKFSKTILDKETSGELVSSMGEIQQFLRATHSDPCRNEPLGNCSRIEPEAQPTTPLEMKEPTFAEIKQVIRKACSGSAPGPNGLPYKVYKNCPTLLHRLWCLLKIVWKKGKVPESWKMAEGIFIPKEKNSTDVNQFRTISLLNVEGKMFFCGPCKETDELSNCKQVHRHISTERRSAWFFRMPGAHQRDQPTDSGSQDQQG